MAMRNVYNIISDGFKRMGLDETRYIVTVDNNKITIKDSSEFEATIELNMDGETLKDFDDTNTLFANLAWNRFCQVFEREVRYPDEFYAFLGALANHANRLGTNAWMT
jgi:hypothetical protein